MKFTIEVDCTPDEAREFLGLPDVKKIQGEWLEKTRSAMLADTSNFSPETLIKNWSSAAAPNLDMMSDLFTSFLKSKT